MNIAVFTNILNPYRMVLFDKIYSQALSIGVSFKVYAMTSEKSDRTWQYEDFKRDYTVLLKSRTIHIKGVAYLHFNTGIKAEIKSFKPDIVVMAGSYLQPTNIYLLSHKKKFGYTTVFWSESHLSETRNYGKLKLQFREFVRHQILGRMDAFWYPGKKALQFIERYKNPSAQTIRVPNTIDNVFFDGEEFDIKNSKQTDKIKSSLKIFFTPARLSPVKGILEFCEILKNIDNKKYLWLIAGDGPLEDDIRKFISDNKINLRLLGMKNSHEIKKLYAECDVFLLPSISDANPLTVIEALWMKKPLFISEHVGNYPEAVIDGKNGYVFSYRDKDDVLAKFSMLLQQDDEWYKNASELSYSIAKEQFNIADIAKSTLASTSKLH